MSLRRLGTVLTPRFLQLPRPPTTSVAAVAAATAAAATGGSYCWAAAAAAAAAADRCHTPAADAPAADADAAVMEGGVLSALEPQFKLLPPNRRLRPDEQARIDLHMRLLAEGKLGRLPMPEGELPLGVKRTPLCELPEGAERDAIPLCTQRGRVDIAPVLEMLRGLPAVAWHPEGQDSNVHLKRAGHDRWGVGKIVLIMCDDLTTKVLHFPWWQSWRPVISPILEQLGVPEGRVIRCLLAAMPAGEHIPTHHDTGDWVPCCHRIHVPIVTHDAVVFSAGYTEEQMGRIATEPGLIFELNNASKHTVYNGWDKPRIHLIFDYVDEVDTASLPAEPIQLVPGQRLLQTRRTIDVVDDDGVDAAAAAAAGAASSRAAGQ
jgi:hypothetical protein